MAIDDPLYVLAPVALAAGFVRGFAGFGGPLLMLPILNHFLVPAASMWIMMWVDLIANVRLLPEARKNASGAVLVPLTVATLAAMPLGVTLVAGSDPLLMKRVIGAAILGAAVLLLSGWRYPWPTRGPTWMAAGILSGIVMGATSLSVIVALFLSADKQTAAQSRANYIVWVFVATIALLVLLVAQGALRPGHLQTVGALAPLYLLGTFGGARLQGRAPEHLVRRSVLLLAATMGGVGAVL